MEQSLPFLFSQKTSLSYAQIVHIYRTFTMTGGTISGNTTTRSQGGGVYVNYNGTFIKSGTGNAVIYGSNAEYEQANRARNDDNGHAVYFGSLWSGSGKKRNTTTRTTTAMDSNKDGPAGGWE